MRILMTLIAVFALAPLAQGQGGHGFFIFADEGQDQDQQDLDEIQCMRTAREMTGFDPMATAVATTAPPPTQGGAVRGAARGAALGAATGALRRGGDAGSGAAAGAAAGGLMGGMRRADSGAQQQQWAQQEAANYQHNRNEWNRAFSACMRSRGYTIG